MKYAKRNWLNPLGHDDTGAVSSYVATHEYGIDAGIQLRDCNRQLDLNFGIWDEDNKGVKELEQRLKKLDIIIEHCTKLKEKLLKAYEVYLDKREKKET